MDYDTLDELIDYLEFSVNKHGRMALTNEDLLRMLRTIRIKKQAEAERNAIIECCDIF